LVFASQGAIRFFGSVCQQDSWLSLSQALAFCKMGQAVIGSMRRLASLPRNSYQSRLREFFPFR
jgi:hypothetical protein